MTNITLPRAELEQVLEAMEEINKLSIGENAICLPAEIDGAMDALRERLAQPEQEPFALLVRKHSWNEGQYECAPPNAPEYGRQWADERVLVYTAPPQRKPLTDEDTVALIKQCRDAFAEELGAWDIEPPIHHVQQGYDNCVNWLAAHGIKGEA